MEKRIVWRSPEGDCDHEIPEGATVTFVRDDSELSVKFDEDESITVGVKSKSVEFAQSYFVPEPEPMPIEEVLKEAKGLMNYKHTMLPDGHPFEARGEIKDFGDGDDTVKAVSIFSCFSTSWMGEMQQVFSPIFAVEKENGKVIDPNDERWHDGNEPNQDDYGMLKSKSDQVSIEEFRPLSLPESDAVEAVVRGVIGKLVKKGWRYLYSIEERGDGKNTYVYARGC